MSETKSDKNQPEDFGSGDLLIGVLLLFMGFSTNHDAAIAVICLGAVITIVKLFHLYYWLKGELK